MSEVEDDVCKCVGIGGVKTHLKDLEELVDSSDYDYKSIRYKVREVKDDVSDIERRLRKLELIQ